jgi:8-oxo-dGTP pyrophosphatase MutT (NUDIX family)
VAGHISAGDNARRTLNREAEEELGLAVRAEEPEYLFSYKNTAGVFSGGVAHKVVCHVFTLGRDVDTASLVLERSEVAMVSYIPFYKFIKMTKQLDRSLVPNWEEYNRLIAAIKNEGQ